MFRRIAGSSLASVVLSTSLVGCGSSEEETSPTPKDTSAPIASVKTVDRLADLKKANSDSGWLGDVKTVEQSSADRLDIETSIVDPRGSDGSPAAKEATRVCRAAVRLLKSEGVKKPSVSVKEDDGTTFVILSYPGYPDGCTEV